MTFTPILTRPHPSGSKPIGSRWPDVGEGSQEIYRFPNGYGASVVLFWGSYGAEVGLKELAVVEFTGEGPTEFLHITRLSITGRYECLGSLTDEAVDRILQQISELPAKVNV